MTVYIELVFLQNFLVDFVLIFSVYQIFKIKKSYARMIFASIFGGAISILFPFLNLPFVLEFFLKILCGFVLTLIAFKTQKFKELFVYFILLNCATFLLGGMVYASLVNFKQNSNLPSFVASVTFCCLLLFLFFAFKLPQVFKKHFKKQKRCIDANIVLNGKNASVKCFYDSGNVLCDGQKNPVSIISFDLFKKFCKDEDLANIKNGCFEKLKFKNQTFLDFSTVYDSSNKLFVFEADSFEIFFQNQKIKVKNPHFGVVFKDVNQHFEILLNSKIL